MFNATLEKRIDLTSELSRFFIRPDVPAKPFSPGQYVAIGLPGSAPRPAHFPPEEAAQDPEKMIKRAYSLASPPDNPELLEIYIAILPQGALTARLASLKEGDRLFVTPKVTGTFTINEVPPDHNLILVSTGTGLAPYLSMIRTASTWSADRSITIVHGVRYPHDLGYREELAMFAKERSNLKYLSVVSRGGDDWAGEKGYVQKFFLEGAIPLQKEKDHVFLCGNPAMIDDMEKLLLEKGFTEHSRKTPGNMHLERYW